MDEELLEWVKLWLDEQLTDDQFLHRLRQYKEAQPFVGKFMSEQWVKDNIFRMPKVA